MVGHNSFKRVFLWDEKRMTSFNPLQIMRSPDASFSAPYLVRFGVLILDNLVTFTHTGPCFEINPITSKCQYDYRM